MSATGLGAKVIVPLGGYKAWLVCLAAGLFFFYEFFQLNVFDVINQLLRTDFQLNATKLSLLSSIYLWADLAFLIPAGILLDYYSTRAVVLSSLFICIVGIIGFALTSSFFLAAFFRFLSGIGNAFCFLACVLLILRWFPRHRQALMIGLVVTMAFLGGMAAHTPFAYLNEYLGWRRSLLLDGLVGVFLWVAIYQVMQDQPDGKYITHKNVDRSLKFLQVLVNCQTWLAGLYTTFLNLPIMVLCALWGASYLQAVYKLSAVTASNVVNLLFIGSIVGCPLVGWLSDLHSRRKPLMIIGALTTLITLMPFFLGFNLTVGMLSILFFALGLFTSTQVISYPLIAESNSLKNTGAATGLASMLIMCGAAIGQILFGILMQKHAGTEKIYTVADFQYALWMFPLATILALIASLLLRETFCVNDNR